MSDNYIKETFHHALLWNVTYNYIVNKVRSTLLILYLQELAIINRSLRQSTIIAKETLELLSIDILVRIKAVDMGNTSCFPKIS